MLLFEFISQLVWKRGPRKGEKKNPVDLFGFFVSLKIPFTIFPFFQIKRVQNVEWIRILGYYHQKNGLIMYYEVWMNGWRLLFTGFSLFIAHAQQTKLLILIPSHSSFFSCVKCQAARWRCIRYINFFAMSMILWEKSFPFL